MRNGRWLWRTSLLLLLGGLLALTGCDDTDLITVGSEREANVILVELQHAAVRGATKAVAGDRRKPAWTIRVPEEQLHAARQVLARKELPKEDAGGFAEVFAQSGLIPTRTDERARLMHAIAGELSKTLEQTIPRVLRARVHVVLPDNSGLGGSRDAPLTPSAAVVIRYEGTNLPKSSASRPAADQAAANLTGVPPAADQATANPATNQPAANPPAADRNDVPISRDEVCKLVARSVEGLRPENVEVSFHRVDLLAEAEDQTAVQRLTVEFAQLQKQVQSLRLTADIATGAAILAALAALVFCILYVLARRRTPQASAASAG